MFFSICVSHYFSCSRNISYFVLGGTRANQLTDGFLLVLTSGSLSELKYVWWFSSLIASSYLESYPVTRKYSPVNWLLEADERALESGSKFLVHAFSPKRGSLGRNSRSRRYCLKNQSGFMLPK